jgi:hypothetical protein
MPNVLYKDNVRLTFDANKKRLRAEGQILLDRVMNEALNEMATQFNDALARGELLEIGGSQAEMRQFLAVAAAKQLGAGNAVSTD